MQDFTKIPLEMRNFKQFVCWKYENRGDEKKTKVPYSPIDGSMASINNPRDWSDYHKAIAESPKYDGIGFVLTLQDPFCFVDFDRTEDPVRQQQQIDLHAQLNSYSEISPGGGLHVICKAQVEAGRRQNAIEVYTSARFMTMTGNVYNDAPIAFKQDVIDTLWASLKGVNSNLEFQDHSEQSEFSDREIYDQAVGATNGEKFLNLWNGDIETYHGGDHSRADFAIVDILSFYTQDREQITRMFRMSGLGRRPKAQRDDYVATMITRSFDRLVPKVNISALMEKVNSFVHENKETDFTAAFQDTPPLVTKTDLQPVHINTDLEKERDDVFQMPPGLTGKIADFIYKQAWKPVPQIAVMGALGFMAGLSGRAYNASGSGLNLYLLLLAKTGRGKEAIAKGYEKIFDSIMPLMPTVGDFAGPGDLASGQALLRYMSDHQTKSFVSVFGEFGPMLKRITSPTAIGADLMTQKVMLDMYGKSGKGGKISPTAYSDAERNTKTIHSPGFSFIAESAPTWFDENVDIGMISTGLLPRFIIAEYDGIRVNSNNAGPSMYPDQSLVQDVCAVATCAMTCFQQNVVVNVPLDTDATRLSNQLDKKCDARINNASDEIIAELWNRVHLNTIRVAGLIAVGINAYQPVIDQKCWEWAEKFITFNIRQLEEKFGRGEISVTGNENEFAELEKLEAVTVQYLTTDYAKIKSYGSTEDLHRCRVIPFAFYQRKLSRLKPFSKAKIGPTNAIRRGLQNLIDNGDLQEISKPQAIKDFEFHGKCFAVRSARILEKARLLVTGD